MKTLLAFFIVACYGITAYAQDDRTPFLTKQLGNDAINSVVVSTSAGGIFVTGRSGEAARIEVYIRGNNNNELSKDEIRKRLDEDYDMNISVNGHELSAIVKNKHEHINWDGRRGLSISFKIYVPHDASTDLHTSGGGIALDDLKGNEMFSTSGGGLDLTKLHGTVHGKTSGGGINISDCGDDIDVHTSGGGITASKCDGTIRLNTSGGGIELNDMKGNITAHTSGGGVNGDHIEGELITGTSGGGIDLHNMNCSLEATTSAGNLNAQMTGVGKYLKLHTSAGSIDLRLPAGQGMNLELSAEQINSNELKNFSGTWDKRSVSGSVNGGGIPIEAHANGSLDVSFGR
jgi:DUF4097 and DUF4098 domain-containing protein YvlB